MAEIIDGRRIAREIKSELRTQVETLAAAGHVPKLSVVLVGENAASQIYVRMKTKSAVELGIASDTILLPRETDEESLLAVVDKLTSDSGVHGILVQLPLPKHIDENRIVNTISPEKDVDGFHPINRGKLLLGEDTLAPCTPLGIQELLIRSGHPPAGKQVVIVGRSKIVGLPLATMLVQKSDRANATVTICHTGTRDLTAFTRKADILVAAVGRAEVITAEMVKDGVVVVDVGVNRVADSSTEKGYRVTGDVDFDSVQSKAAAITPVPGGVGPMTIAMLMHNTVQAASKICASSSTG